ncbi:unnamed protein product [Absidia cylindrospora]
MANRVIDTRSCELAPTRMTVSDIKALATFMQALRKEPASLLPPDYENDNSSKLELQKRTSRGIVNTSVPRPDSTELLVQEETTDNHSQQFSLNEHSLHDGSNNNNNVNSSRSVSSSNSSSNISPSVTPYRRQRLGSLGKIFPYAPNIVGSSSQQQSHSHVSSGQALDTPSPQRLADPQDTVSILSQSHLSTDWNNSLQQPADGSFLTNRFKQLADTMSYVFKPRSDNSVEPSMDSASGQGSPSSENNDDGDVEDASVILFDGWSLWIFSPSSKIRLYLWMIIASGWYEVFSLLLLFTQWLVLSCMPIHNHEQKHPFLRYKLLFFVLSMVLSCLR